MNYLDSLCFISITDKTTTASNWKPLQFIKFFNFAMNLKVLFYLSFIQRGYFHFTKNNGEQCFLYIQEMTLVPQELMRMISTIILFDVDECLNPIAG